MSPTVSEPSDSDRMPSRTAPAPRDVLDPKQRCTAEHVPGQAGHWHIVIYDDHAAGEAALARREPLDVEVLARAIRDVLMRTSFSAWIGTEPPYVEDIAQRIAAEYERLRDG